MMMKHVHGEGTARDAEDGAFIEKITKFFYLMYVCVVMIPFGGKDVRGM